MTPFGSALQSSTRQIGARRGTPVRGAIALPSTFPRVVWRLGPNCPVAWADSTAVVRP